MPEKTAKPWEQLPDESDASYLEFLFYRDAGPGRTAVLAYQSYLTWKDGTDGGVTRIPGSWQIHAREHHWKDRADAWDVHMFARAGRRATVALVAAIEQLALKTLRAVRSVPDPATIEELLECMKFLRDCIPQESADAIAAEAGDVEDGDVEDGGEPLPQSASRLLPRSAGLVAVEQAGGDCDCTAGATVQGAGESEP